MTVLSSTPNPLEKIILFSEPAFKQENLRPEYEDILTRHGAEIREPLPLVNGVLCSFPGVWQLQNMTGQEKIRIVEDNVRVKLYPVNINSSKIIFKRDNYQIIPWGIHRIGADQVWPYSKGERIKVGVLDTGADLHHRDLEANIKGGVNILLPGQMPQDDNGHGTHVSGIIAAVDNNFGVLGTAPGVYLYPVKVLDRRGEGMLADVIRGLDWCRKKNMDLINISFGTDQPSQSLHEAVRRLTSENILIAAAAGNDGTYQSVDYPAAYPEVIAVGAVDEYDQLTEFNSRGPEIKLVAPGNKTISSGLKNTFKRMSGTSMAAPHVTGTLALLKALAPREKAGQLLELLYSTSEKLPSLNVFQLDAGLVRVDLAAQELKNLKRKTHTTALFPIRSMLSPVPARRRFKKVFKKV